MWFLNVPRLPIFAQNRPTMDHKPDQWPLPAGMSVTESPDLLVLTHKWNKWIGYAMLVIWAIWSTGLCFDFGEFVDLLQAEGAHFELLFAFPILGLNLFLLYGGLAHVLNATTTTIDFEELKIKHAPIPWINNRAIYRGDVKQLYVKQHVTQRKKGTSYFSSSSYSINVVVQGRKDLELVTGIGTAEDAKFVEQKIEHYLKISDRPVPGEHRG